MIKQIIIEQDMKIQDTYLSKDSKIYVQMFEAVNEKEFYRYIQNKQAFVIFGFGNAVDKQKSDTSQKVFLQVLKQFFGEKANNVRITGMGRYGMLNKTKMWMFDTTMETSGHPSDWIPDSRGYFCTTDKSLFFFPKDDAAFLKLGKDISTNVLRGATIKKVNEPNIGW